MGLTALVVLAALWAGVGDGPGEPADGLPPANRSLPDVAAGEFNHLIVRHVYARNIKSGPVARNYEYWTLSTWRSSDGAGRLVRSGDLPALDETYEAGGFPLDVERPGLADLPSDPDELRHVLLGNAFNGSPVADGRATPGQSPQSVRLTRIAADIVTSPMLLPRQRVAVLELLATFQGDGVDVVRGEVDPAGRPATLITFETTSGPTLYEMYVDPSTHDLLASLALIPKSGQLVEGAIHVRASVTDSVEESGENWLPEPQDELELPLEPER
jgi:hypothetical protein